MLWFWLAVMWLLPSVCCVLFVWFAAHPDVLTAVGGTFVGVMIALCALFILH